MQKLLTRTVLPTVAQYIPPHMQASVPTVYLGMPPLVIGGMQKSVTTSLSGISTGRVVVSAQSNRTTDITGRIKGRANGAVRKAGKRAGIKRTTPNNTNERPKRKRKAKARTAGAVSRATKSRGRRKLGVLGRNSKGRFTKK